jgi:Virulence factor BrkB
VTIASTIRGPINPRFRQDVLPTRARVGYAGHGLTMDRTRRDEWEESHGFGLGHLARHCGSKRVVAALLNYLLAIIMVLCVGVLLFLSLALSTAVPMLVDFLGKGSPFGAGFWKWLDAGVSFVLLTLFFALVFRVMSGRRIAWRDVLYGSFVSALLFTVGKTLISLYTLLIQVRLRLMGLPAQWLCSWSGCITRRRLRSSGPSWLRPDARERRG